MRTFLCIEMPPAIQTLVRQVQQAIETVLAAVQQDQTIRWTAPAAVHLTVRFLGETTKEQYQALQGPLAQLTGEQKPFGLTVQEIGCFPNTHAPTIVWLGLQPEGEALFHLQKQVEQAVQSVGFAAEPKPFRPHLTIGRLRHTIGRTQQRAIGQQLARVPALPTLAHASAPRFAVTRLVHMQSHLEPTGAHYTPLQVYKFAER